MEEVVRGRVFNQALVRLQESGFREVRKRGGEGEGKQGKGEGKNRAESKCGYMVRPKDRCCELTMHRPKQKNKAVRE